jgi:hypothetical protein
MGAGRFGTSGRLRAGAFTLATAAVLAACGSGAGDVTSSAGTAPSTSAVAASSSASTSTSTTAASSTTTRPTTTAARTTSTSPTTPATTAPPTTVPPTSGRPPATTAPPPAVASISVPSSVDCLTAADPGSLTISWATSGATSVTVGIQSPDPFEAGLPPTGSLTVPFAGCGDGQDKEYFVTALDAAGRRTVQSRKVSPSFSPAVAGFDAPATVACPATSVRLSWKVTNATSVYVAIDNPSGPFQTDLPLTGTLEVPFAGCGDGQPKTYYVVAQGKPGSQPVVAQRVVTPG